MKRFFKILLSIIVCLLGLPLNINAQRETNNIYIFDCTGSMKTQQLWDTANDALGATIKNQASIPCTEFIVIPFGTHPDQPIRFDANDVNLKELRDILNSKIKSDICLHTNISEALKVAFNNTDTIKDNNFYLITDGQPDGGDTSENVATTIRKWCANHKNSRLFYVALHHNVNPIIKKAIDNCDDAYIVEVTDKVIPLFADISPDELYTNIDDLSNELTVNFSLPGSYKVRVENSDSLFNVRIKDGEARNGKILLTLSSKDEMDVITLRQYIHGKDYDFTVRLESEDKKIRIVNPELVINVSDKRLIKLSLCGGEEEIFVEGVKWYDPFLWSDAADMQKVEWNLAPIFENEISDSGLKLKFQVSAKEDEDFKAWYNNQPLKNGGIIEIKPGQRAMLEIQFDEKAKTGKRYFNLVPIETFSIDLINGQPSDTYEGTSLRTEYNVRWNPLKTFLFWLGIVLLVLLVLWFLFIKPFVFPTIKVSRIDFTGPGTYYKTKKIKGARKVVFTNSKKSQNIFSRIFTGEIRYVKADHFNPDIVIIPTTKRDKVKIMSGGKAGEGWIFYPSSTFNRHEQGTITNQQTKETSKIEIN